MKIAKSILQKGLLDWWLLFANLEIEQGGVWDKIFWDKLTWNFVEEFHKLMINYIRYFDENVFSTLYSCHLEYEPET